MIVSLLSMHSAIEEWCEIPYIYSYTYTHITPTFIWLVRFHRWLVAKCQKCRNQGTVHPTRKSNGWTGFLDCPECFSYSPTCRCSRKYCKRSTGRLSGYSDQVSARLQCSTARIWPSTSHSSLPATCWHCQRPVDTASDPLTRPATCWQGAEDHMLISMSLHEENPPYATRWGHQRPVGSTNDLLTAHATRCGRVQIWKVQNRSLP